ncbi:MAG TPA: GAF domain-containing protein [Nitrospiria bacterium]
MIDFRFGILAATVSLNILLAVVILFRGKQNRINYSFGLLLICVALWAFGNAMFRVAATAPEALLWSRILYWSAAMIPSTFFFFARVFPQETGRTGFAPTLAIFSFPLALAVLLPTGGFLVTGVEFLPGGTEPVLDPFHYLIYTAWFVILLGWGFLHLRQKYDRFEGLPKLQIRYVLMGTLPSALLGAAFNLVLPWLGNFTLMWLGPVFTIIMIACISYAIIRYRLMDIRVIIKRTIVYSSLLVLVLSFYALIILASQQIFENRIGTWVSLVLSAFLVAAGFDPLRRLFQRATDRIFFQSEKNSGDLLARLSEALNSIEDLDRLLDRVTAEMTDFFGVDRMAILVIEDDKLRTGQRAAPFKGLNRSHLLLKYFWIAPDQKDLLFLDEIRRRNDDNPFLTGANQMIIKKMEEMGITVVLPIHLQDRLIGFFVVGSKRSGEGFTAEDLQVFELIARQAAASIDNALLYQRRKTEAALLTTLMEVGTLLNSAVELQDLFDKITVSVSNLLRADSCSVMLLDAGRTELRVRATHGNHQKLLRPKILPIGKGIPGWVARKGQPLLLDTLAYPKQFIDYTDYDKEIYSSICVPLKVRGRVIGVLSIDSFSKEKKFDEKDFKVLQLFSSQAAVAIENLQLHKTMAPPVREIKPSSPRNE